MYTNRQRQRASRMNARCDVRVLLAGYSRSRFDASWLVRLQRRDRNDRARAVCVCFADASRLHTQIPCGSRTRARFMCVPIHIHIHDDAAYQSVFCARSQLELQTRNTYTRNHIISVWCGARGVKLEFKVC